jgi:hypothetical protein
LHLAKLSEVLFWIPLDDLQASHRTRERATMSRSAADATRFTATGPYANSKTGGFQAADIGKSKKANQKTQSLQYTGPDGKPETPKEKVERLRAQARAAKRAQALGTGADRWIESGRRFANKAHKGMVYTLIAASGMFPALWRLSVEAVNASAHTRHDNQQHPLIPDHMLIILDSNRCLRCPYSLLHDLTYAL